MGRREKLAENDIVLEGSKEGFRLFRNNVGLFFAGVWDKVNKVIKNPRPVYCGLYKGSGDYIGFKEIEITKEMVGKKVAVFCSVEAKAVRLNGKQREGKASPDQKDWRDKVNRFSGFACVAKTSGEMKKAWDEFMERLKG